MPGASHASERVRVEAPTAAVWPFVYPLAVEFPTTPSRLTIDGLHEMFVNRQTAGTRLVTTQATYWLTALRAAIGDRDVIVEATADAEAVREFAPELLSGTGPFGGITIVGVAADRTEAREQPDAPGASASAREDSQRGLRRDLAGAASGREGGSRAPSTAAPELPAAFRASDPGERLAICVRALDAGRTPAALAATASVCMEVNDLDAAARDLDEAIDKAPEWAAAHFERGKTWLRLDDLEKAASSFRAAAERLPRFGPAWANLGAALGELDRPTDALDAFTRAIECDPSSAQTHNNIGVLARELGDLSQSEASFRRVLELAPDRAFGYYNLGHTLFLQGRYQAALAAYAEGQKRDAERNPVQSSRLAVCRLATGDAPGAIAELQRATHGLPPEYRHQLLADVQSIAWALLTHRPDLPGWQHVNEWLQREQTR